MQLKLITDTTGGALSLGEAKAHLNISTTTTGTDADELIREEVKAATAFVERLVPGHRALMPQTWDLITTGWPEDDTISVPLPPTQAITHVKYYNSTGTLTTLSATGYTTVIPEHGQATIDPAYNEVWPTARTGIPDAVQVRFEAGYSTAGSTASRSSVPAPLKQAVRMVLGHFHENREAVTVGQVGKELEFAVKSLVRSYDYGAY